MEDSSDDEYDAPNICRYDRRFQKICENDQLEVSATNALNQNNNILATDFNSDSRDEGI